MLGVLRALVVRFSRSLPLNSRAFFSPIKRVSALNGLKGQSFSFSHSFSCNSRISSIERHPQLCPNAPFLYTPGPFPHRTPSRIRLWYVTPFTARKAIHEPRTETSGPMMGNAHNVSPSTGPQAAAFSPTPCACGAGFPPHILQL
jgi:hypothetical protein